MSETNTNSIPSQFRILAIDGGGIRGAFFAGFLAELERHIGSPIGGYFDLITGTSTGGIVAAALAMRVPASRIEAFYAKHGPIIFQRSWDKPTHWFQRRIRVIYRLPTRLIDVALSRTGLDYS